MAQILVAEEKVGATLPDFTKSFPKEKLFIQTQPGEGETYGYATDLSFEELKKQLQSFLGKEWEAEVLSEEERKGMEASKKKGIEVVDSCAFVSTKFSGIRIILSQIKMSFYGKSFFASISPKRQNAEQGVPPKSDRAGG